MREIEKYRSNIINRLKEISIMWQDKKELKDSIEYTLLNSGKLARSVIILLGLSDLKIEVQKGLDIACALEMIQSYTLIHDDLPEMDNATTRREKKSNHLVYGHGQALLTGDTLLTDSFLVISNSNLKIEQKIKIIELFANKAGSNGVCYGQVLDLINVDNLFNSWEEIEKIIKFKTCSLFELAFNVVGIIANLDMTKNKRLEKIGYLFGLAFQIKDDLNDYLNITANIGKDVCQDDKKCTYHKIYGIDQANQKIDQIFKEIEEECIKTFGIENKIYNYLLSLIK